LITGEEAHLAMIKTSYQAREAVTTARMSQEEAQPEKKEAVVVDLSNDDE
jgi:hypothetical protein